MSTCSIDGCSNVAAKRTWCEKHYQRWKAHGHPLTLVRPTYGSRRRVRSDGYIAVYEPEHPLANVGGYVAEHRKVAWDAGLFSDPALQVHHRNHDKTDNRVENLEVLDVAEHARRHAAEDGSITNQYGTFPLRRAGLR